jgi:SAM-dependent methyltransferase
LWLECRRGSCDGWPRSGRNEMTRRKEKKYRCSWEEAIELLRDDPQHRDLIHNSYLTRDLQDNCTRFAASEEFAEVLRLLGRYAPAGRRLLDMPGGNGIASFAFSGVGYEVTTVEPNPSDSVGRGAIALVTGKAGGGKGVEIVGAWGEALPFLPASFDVVYVRQGLHHASCLEKMLLEIARVMRPGGVLVACREHVVDNYGKSLEAFLASQPDHQLYGGENAFTLGDYRKAIAQSGLVLEVQFGPYDSMINSFPNTPDVLRTKILSSGVGRLLGAILPDDLVARIGMWRLRTARSPGRLYTFVARKPAAPC